MNVGPDPRKDVAAEDVEADPADVAEQQLAADPDQEDDEADLDANLPDEANPADVVDQRREVPEEEPEL